MSAEIYIPPAYLELTVDCYEQCGLEDTPDVMIGHLVEDHGYSLGRAQDWLQDWIESFETDTDGHPLSPTPCSEHGPIRAGEPCHGCEAVDAAVDRYFEERDFRRAF